MKCSFFHQLRSFSNFKLLLLLLVFSEWLWKWQKWRSLSDELFKHLCTLLYSHMMRKILEWYPHNKKPAEGYLCCPVIKWNRSTNTFFMFASFCGILSMQCSVYMRASEVMKMAPLKFNCWIEGEKKNCLFFLLCSKMFVLKNYFCVENTFFRWTIQCIFQRWLVC